VIVKNLFSHLLGCAAAVIAGGIFLSVDVRGQAQPGPEPVKKEFSQKVAEGMVKLKEYTDANNTAKSIELLDELLKIGTPGDSYDQAQLSLYKGNLTLPLEDSRVAIEPLEKFLDITSRVDFSPVITINDIKGAHKNLSIVYYIAADRKDVPEAQKLVSIGKAVSHLEAYFKMSGEPTADEANQYASFLFKKATMAGEDDKVDLATIKQAREVAQRGVLRDTRFRTDLYKLILTAYQYERNSEGTAETMELLLARSPNDAEAARLWQLLPSIYLGLANSMAEKNDDDRAREFRYRAILAYERAHQYAGLFNGEKGEDSTMDILNLSKTYFDVGQIEKGAEIMLEAARAKKIKGTFADRVWLFIAEYYRQVGKEDKTIAVYKEASANFPQDGQFDLQLANTYYALDQIDNAITSIQSALRKGLAGKEPVARLSEAYYLYSSNRFKEASEAASKGLALASLPASTASQLKQIKDAAETALASKEAAKEKM
jgi:hypothetical protein